VGTSVPCLTRCCRKLRPSNYGRRPKIGTISFGPPQIGRRSSNNIKVVSISRDFPPTGGVIFINLEVSGRISYAVFDFLHNVVFLTECGDCGLFDAFRLRYAFVISRVRCCKGVHKFSLFRYNYIKQKIGKQNSPLQEIEKIKAFYSRNLYDKRYDNDASSLMLPESTLF